MFSKADSKPTHRPSRIALATMCVALALLLVVNGLLVALIPPNFNTINSFLYSGPNEAELAPAKEASANMTQTIAGEGIVLLENKSGTLPIQQGAAVNLFGYGSRDTVYGGSGSGSGNSTNNVTLAQGLENAGFSVNPDLVAFYNEHFVERTGVGFTGNNFDINEPAVSAYSDQLLADAKAYSDVAVFVVSRLGGEGADLPMDMDPNLTTEIVASGAVVQQTIKGGDAGKHYLELQSVEQQVLEMLTQNFGTVVVVINATNAMELGFLQTSGVDAAWEGSFPKERAAESREASAQALAVINSTEIGLDDAAQDIVFAQHGLSIEDMAGLDYDDPQWQQLLEQVSVKEMVNLVSNGGWATQAVASVGKLGYVEVDGPNGINNIMAGTTGVQYCAQSLLACSWNTDLAFEMGQVFGQEAVAMGVAGLYAPAMNIHRSPFSGRNYEYYSEDGVHSGKMAAAETLGIQSQGVTTYAKHFAINDQESNRDSGGLLTWVNEQAAREIYLKPFELAVKEGETRGMMSSFNRIGAVCAAESPQLLKTVLRDEWGFEGTVITDCILQLSYINIDRAIANGNDLILALMNFQSPTEALTGSAAGRQALRTATHNILYTAANSVGQQISAVPVPYGLYIGVGVVDVALLGLCVLYFVRRKNKMKRWKAEQNMATA